MRLSTKATHFLIGLLLMSCGSSTRIVQSWRDPGTTVEQGSVKKMLVIALVQDEATRRRAEDELSTQFLGRCESSYRYLGPLPEKIEKDAFVQRLRADGFDAVMVMRLVDVTKEQTYVAGSYPTYYHNPWGYYGYAYPMYADPGYVRTDLTYRAETNFYSVNQEKLVWTGIPSSMNPVGFSTTLTEIVTAIRQKMEREGFLTKPPVP